MLRMTVIDVFTIILVQINRMLILTFDVLILSTYRFVKEKKIHHEIEDIGKKCLFTAMNGFWKVD